MTHSDLSLTVLPRRRGRSASWLLQVPVDDPVNSVMKAPGARVEATNVEGSSSRFRLLLPQADGMVMNSSPSRIVAKPWRVPVSPVRAGAAAFGYNPSVM